MCPWPTGATKTDDQAKSDGSNPVIDLAVSLDASSVMSPSFPKEAEPRRCSPTLTTARFASQTPKLATVCMEPLVQASPEAVATSDEAATSAAAVCHVVPTIGTTQLGQQAKKVTVVQASAGPIAERVERQKNCGLQVISLLPTVHDALR